MQLLTLLPSVQGGLPEVEARAAQLGSLGYLGTGCTHKFVLSRGAGLTLSLSHHAGPDPSQGSSNGTREPKRWQLQDQRLKSEIRDFLRLASPWSRRDVVPRQGTHQDTDQKQ